MTDKPSNKTSDYSFDDISSSPVFESEIFSTDKKLSYKSVDSIPYLSSMNKTLNISNNQRSGWQKRIVCSIAYDNIFHITTVSTSPVYDTSRKTILIWLAFYDDPFHPFECKYHNEPLVDLELRREKYYLLYKLLSLSLSISFSFCILPN